MKKILTAIICISLFAACKKTKPVPVGKPALTTTAASSITQTTASSGGNVTSDGGAAITARGVVWSTSASPTVALTTKTSDGTGTGNFTSNITGLTANTKYYVRSYATNSAGTAYGNEISFTTAQQLNLPILTSTAASSITQTTASSGGSITSDGGASITARGVVWSTSPSPTVALITKTTDGSGTGNFTSNITGLSANTTYYVRAYATNSIGTAYGNEVSFKTEAQLSLPILTTTAVTSITQKIATSGGNITNDGGASITARGVVWSTTSSPTVALTTKTSDGSGTGNFSSNITGLTANTKYYVRAYATNSVGTAYGNEISFTTASIPTSVTDIDNNVYPVVTIGTQVWMKENLRTTRYLDGSVIPLVTDNAIWGNNSNKSPMMCWYNNDKTTYTTNKIGALYNFYVINPASNGNKKVCPAGWHVPTNDEWDALIGFLDPNFSVIPPAGQPQSKTAGGLMKTTGTTAQDGLWNAPNTGATNSSNFSGLPGGSRGASGNFGWLGVNAYWWSSTDNGGGVWVRIIQSYNTNVVKDSYNKEEGLSVRCVLD